MGTRVGAIVAIDLAGVGVQQGEIEVADAAVADREHRVAIARLKIDVVRGGARFAELPARAAAEGLVAAGAHVGVEEREVLVDRGAGGGGVGDDGQRVGAHGRAGGRRLHVRGGEDRARAPKEAHLEVVAGVAGRAEAHHRVALTAGVLREPVPLAVDEVDVGVGGAGATERGERVASTGLEGQGRTSARRAR
jgi:hypothetical protein